MVFCGWHLHLKVLLTTFALIFAGKVGLLVVYVGVCQVPSVFCIKECLLQIIVLSSKGVTIVFP